MEIKIRLNSNFDVVWQWNVLPTRSICRAVNTVLKNTNADGVEITRFLCRGFGETVQRLQM